MEQLINFIIRPPRHTSTLQLNSIFSRLQRAEYDPKNDLLDQEFMLKGKWFHRKDVEVKNSRGDTLQCTHYMPIVRPEGKSLPCVIYCHGNRADASEAAIILLPSNITVFTLDFSGSGLSGGEHVTLGWNEKDDLKAVVEFLRADGNISMIGLWGRSMGAVTSLMYGAEDPSIAGMVLDSPFSDLVDLMMELVDTYKVRLPKFTVKFAIQYMKRAIQKKAKFDITELNTIKVAKSSFVPVLLGHAVEDDFIQPHHSDRIFDAYMGDKNIIKFEGDHNSPRPQFYFDSINIFFHNVLQPPDDDVEGTFFGPTPHDYYDRENWTTLHEVGYANNNLSTATIDPAASSTEEVIEQLRNKRPMSRTDVPSDITSNDKQPDSQEGSGTKPSPSSSSMISLEFSNGHSSYGSHATPSIDDDDYVEYSFDSLADFPSNAEEEERMLMEAMMMSLKEMDIVPGVEEHPASTDVIHKETSQHGKAIENDNGLATDQCTTTRAELPFEPSSLDSSACTGTSTPSVASTTMKSSKSVDMGDSTKATVTVERTTSGNILDGLMKRWDLNFFRNNR